MVCYSVIISLVVNIKYIREADFIGELKLFFFYIIFIYCFNLLNFMLIINGIYCLCLMNKIITL